MESGNKTETLRLAETPGLESKTREILGSPPSTHQSTATGPKGLERMVKHDLTGALFAKCLTILTLIAWMGLYRILDVLAFVNPSDFRGFCRAGRPSSVYARATETASWA